MHRHCGTLELLPGSWTKSQSEKGSGRKKAIQRLGSRSTGQGKGPHYSAERVIENMGWMPASGELQLGRTFEAPDSIDLIS